MSMIGNNIAVIRKRHLPRWRTLKALFIEWRQRARTRGELMALNDRELWDMGLSRGDACNEFDKPFWQP